MSITILLVPAMNSVILFMIMRRIYGKMVESMVFAKDMS